MPNYLDWIHSLTFCPYAMVVQLILMGDGEVKPPPLLNALSMLPLDQDKFHCN